MMLRGAGSFRKVSILCNSRGGLQLANWSILIKQYLAILSEWERVGVALSSYGNLLENWASGLLSLHCKFLPAQSGTQEVHWIVKFVIGLKRFVHSWRPLDPFLGVYKGPRTIISTVQVGSHDLRGVDQRET